jgi:hypothetical protein
MPGSVPHRSTIGGQSYDVASSRQERVRVTLGRHNNDPTTSFYAKTPSSLMIECGWGGREIDPPNWRPCELRDSPEPIRT